MTTQLDMENSTLLDTTTQLDMENSTTLLPISEDLDVNITVTPLPKIYSLTGMLYFTAACTIIITIVGISGNLLTIIALWKSPKYRNSATSAFIISLSAADFIFCCINLPLSASRFIYRDWVHGDDLCIVFPYIRYANVGLSLMSIATITINRYVLIVHTSVYERMYQKKFIGLTIATIWVFSFAMLLPTLFGKWGKFGFDPKILNCSILEVGGRSPKTFLFVFGFLLPCLVIVFCYARIFWVVVRSKTKVRKHSSNDSKDQVQKKDKKRSEEWKVTRMVLVIFCSFVACYLPITIIKVVDKEVKFPALHLLSYIMIYTSACVNPIIYGITNRQYRKAYRNVLLCMKSGMVNVRSRMVFHTSHDSSTQGGTGTAVYTVQSKSATNSNDSVFMNIEK